MALGTVGGVINLITEQTPTKGMLEFLGFTTVIIGTMYFLIRNRSRVNDHIFDWSGSWNDDRRAREHAGEIAANSWEFDGNPMWIEGIKTDSRGRTEIVLGTPKGKIITHNIKHVRRPP